MMCILTRTSSSVYNGRHGRNIPNSVILTPLGIPNPTRVPMICLSNNRRRWGGLSHLSCGCDFWNNASITKWWIYRFSSTIFEWEDRFRVLIVQFTPYWIWAKPESKTLDDEFTGEKNVHQYMELNMGMLNSKYKSRKIKNGILP